mmetsp:Transcript_17875/g.43730  ORF Transcript_17875/g.43730 Transcript_17875/m.43730 type:complete len:704 (-) Transcript_17875:107-2218(-)
MNDQKKAIKFASDLGQAFTKIANDWTKNAGFEPSKIGTWSTEDITRLGISNSNATIILEILQQYTNKNSYGVLTKSEKSSAIPSHNESNDEKDQEKHLTLKDSYSYTDIFEVTDAAPKQDGKFVFKEQDIKILKILGEGNFATTYKAAINSDGKDPTEIALKVPKDNISSDECKKEMMGLLNVAGQHNIMKFIGIAQLKEQQCFLTELCELGSMDSLHHKFNLREEKIFTEIAKGLFLGLMHLQWFRIIHRDIACRNLLVKTGFQIRIADFGLAVRAPDGKYAIMPGESLPWPWMPPETLKSGTFTFKSDIWAAGVTLWEILHEGGTPYANELSQVNPATKMKSIISGNAKLKAPKEATTIEKMIMQKCLNFDSKLRPDACDVLLDLIPGGLAAIREQGTKEMRDVARAKVAAGIRMVEMNEPRSSSAAVAFDNRLYVVGGSYYEVELKSAEMLDLNEAHATWTQLPKMRTERSYLGAALWDGKLYAGGGIAGYEDMFTSVEVLDLRNVSAGWSEMPSLSSGGMLHMIAHDCKLYALSSETVECLNLSNVKAGWKVIANSDEKPSGVVIYDSKLFTLCEKHGLRWIDISSDISTDGKDGVKSWTDVTTSDGKVCHTPACSAVGILNGNVFIVGGEHYSATEEVKMLDLSNVDAGWKKVGKLSTRKDSACTVALGDNLFVMGGKLNGSPIKMVEKLRVGVIDSV